MGRASLGAEVVCVGRVHTKHKLRSQLEVPPGEALPHLASPRVLGAPRGGDGSSKSLADPGHGRWGSTLPISQVHGNQKTQIIPFLSAWRLRPREASAFPWGPGIGKTQPNCPPASTSILPHPFTPRYLALGHSSLFSLARRPVEREAWNSLLPVVPVGHSRMVSPRPLPQ